jgi:two-component system chemotaxis response regulator CheB
MSPGSPGQYEIVALAASAGGLHALSVVLPALPPGFEAALVVVQHLAPGHRSLLAEILRSRVRLPIRDAQEGDRLVGGTIYLAPVDRHLLVTPEHTLTLTHTEPVHFVRPAADRLFESVARSYGARAIAVVLTGSGCDGEQGVVAVKRAGGWVLAQDQATSENFGMPGAAIHTGVVDQVLPLDRVAPALIALVKGANSG